MARAFKIIGTVEKKVRFDIFGFFTKESAVDTEAQPALADKAAKQWCNANGFEFKKVRSFGMEGGKFAVTVEVA